MLLCTNKVKITVKSQIRKLLCMVQLSDLEIFPKQVCLQSNKFLNSKYSFIILWSFHKNILAGQDMRLEFFFKKKHFFLFVKHVLCCGWFSGHFSRVLLVTRSFAEAAKKAVLNSFAIFTGKHLCWSLFLIKLQACRPFT